MRMTGYKAGWSIFLFLFLSLTAFSGCQSGEELPAGCSIRDGKLSVVLEENPGTGYAWQAEVGDGAVLVLESDSFVQGGSSGRVGAPGERTWVFRGFARGESRLDFRYFRSWEGPSSETAHRSFVVTVGAGGMITGCRDAD